MKYNRGKRGFTLLEVMIASVMGTFIALVALGTLRTVTTAKAMINDNTTVADELRFAADRIYTDLMNIYRDVDTRNVKFVGTIEDDGYGPAGNLTMRIVGGIKARASEPESDVYEVQYFVSRDGENSVLMRRLCPIVGVEDDTETQGGILTAIAENIIDFDLQYYYEGQWWSEWSTEQGSLPSLVSVSLAAAGENATNEQDVMTKSFIVNFPRMGQQTEEDFDNVNEGGSE